jgi:hypothetical protein
MWFFSFLVMGALGFYTWLTQNGSGSLPFLFLMVAIIVLGFRPVKKWAFDLADEVWDDGTALLVKRGGKEQRVVLSDIKSVTYPTSSNPPHVVISLRQPTVFGDQIRFFGRWRMRILPFTSSPEIDDLIDRVDKARDLQSRR